jgi:hypothetical protein
MIGDARAGVSPKSLRIANRTRSACDRAGERAAAK